MEKSVISEEQQTTEQLEQALRAKSPEFIELLDNGTAEEREVHLDVIKRYLLLSLTVISIG